VQREQRDEAIQNSDGTFGLLRFVRNDGGVTLPSAAVPSTGALSSPSVAPAPAATPEHAPAVLPPIFPSGSPSAHPSG
jgi:hypothetical protein